MVKKLFTIPIYMYSYMVESLVIIGIAMAINLLDMMSENDRELVKIWAKERLSPKYPQDIPIPYYTLAELGHYYGWQAVVDLKRGYHAGINQKGEPERIRFTFEEATALIKAAKKVEYKLKA